MSCLGAVRFNLVMVLVVSLVLTPSVIPAQETAAPETALAAGPNEPEVAPKSFVQDAEAPPAEAQSKSLEPIVDPVVSADGPMSEDTVVDIEPLPIEVGSVAWEMNFDQEIQWYYKTLLGVLVVSTGNSLFGVDGLTGKMLWTLPVHVEQQSVQEVARTHVLLLLNVFPPEAFGDKKAKKEAEKAEDSNGEDPTVGDYSMAIDQLTGTELWKNANAIDLDPILVYPMYEQEKVFIATVNRDFSTNMGRAIAGKLTLGIVKGDKAKGKTYMIDLVDGTYLWERKVLDPEGLKFWPTDDDVLELRPKNVLDIDADTGEKRWKLDTKDKSVEVVPGTLVIAEGKIKAFDLAYTKKSDLKKSMLWVSKPTKEVGKINFVRSQNDRMYFAGNKGFACLDATSGDVLWDEGKDGKGRPMEIWPSPDGVHALGIVERRFGIPGFKVQDASSVRLIVMNATSGTIVGEYPSDDSDANYAQIGGAVEAANWLDDTHIHMKTSTRDFALAVNDGSLDVLWERERPAPIKFPEDIEAEKALKKKQRKTILIVAAAALVGGALLGEDFGEVLLIAGTAAVAAAILLSRQTGEIRGMSDPNDPKSRIAYERFKKRRERLDQRKVIEIVETEEGYSLQELDLITGKVTACGGIPTRGKAQVDSMFRLVFQRDFDQRTSIRAYVVEGYSASLVEEFAM